MNRLRLLPFLLLILSLNLKAQTSQYENYPVYNGTDLGLTWSNSAAAFRIWSPVASRAQLLLYKDGLKGDAFKTLDMSKGPQGTWAIELKGNYVGVFYAFRVMINGNWNDPVPDPYAKSVGVNGKRAMVVDLEATNPEGWGEDKSPFFTKNNLATDAIIYELHVRDATIDSSSGVQHKGKFLGLTETGTRSPDGLPTGLDHLQELGITHIHLLPIFDFNSVDETRLDVPQYNWGYDPLNYNAPEGSYSTNPYDGVTRIRELKQLVETFHQHGLRVIMDVVYNHTGTTNGSSFQQLCPGYYYRHKGDGSLSNATGCGNETASEMPMMRKFMLESVLYWAKEYHMDGFRFDLMAVHDIQTMNLISDSLHKIKPDIIIYGEGWQAGYSPMPDSLMALKSNAAKLDRIAVFSDDIRDGIKGSVFDIHDRGFASGKLTATGAVQKGIITQGIDPFHIITYCECHDNPTLWDKLTLSCRDASEADRESMQKLALTIILTSQGIPFLYEGTEFLKSKKGVENSFNAPDSINAIRWTLKQQHLDITRYVEGLIRMRKAHPAFRMSSAQDIAQNLHFEAQPNGLIAYQIDGKAAGDSWKRIWVAFNGTSAVQVLSVPAGSWTSAVGPTTTSEGSVHIPAYSACILYQE
jgi:pullulanase